MKSSNPTPQLTDTYTVTKVEKMVVRRIKMRTYSLEPAPGADTIYRVTLTMQDRRPGVCFVSAPPAGEWPAVGDKIRFDGGHGEVHFTGLRRAAASSEGASRTCSLNWIDDDLDEDKHYKVVREHRFAAAFVLSRLGALLTRFK